MLIVAGQLPLGRAFLCGRQEKRVLPSLWTATKKTMRHTSIKPKPNTEEEFIAIGGDECNGLLEEVEMLAVQVKDPQSRAKTFKSN